MTGLVEYRLESLKKVINFLFLSHLDMNKFLILFSFLCFLSCQKEREKKEVSPIKKPSKKIERTPKKKKEKKIDLDTINNKNAVAFLKLYGKKNPETLVNFQTEYGDIKIRLYKDTPLHRASFIFLTKTGYFNYTNFHRVIKDFIIQGGSSDHPLTRKLRIKYRSYRIPAEIKSNRKHVYGALAAAREWDNNPKKVSSPFEFYIIQSKNGSHHLDGEHTIFGQVISGMKVVDKIASLETDRNDWPIKDVHIKAEVIR